MDLSSIPDPRRGLCDSTQQQHSPCPRVFRVDHPIKWAPKTSKDGARSGFRWSHVARGTQLAPCSYREPLALREGWCLLVGTKKVTLQHGKKHGQPCNGEEQYFETKYYSRALDKYASNRNPARAQRATSRTLGPFRFLSGAAFSTTNNECPTAGKNQCSGNQKQTQSHEMQHLQKETGTISATLVALKSTPIRCVQFDPTSPRKGRDAKPPTSCCRSLLLGQRVTFWVKSLVMLKIKRSGGRYFGQACFAAVNCTNPPPSVVC